MAEHHPGYEKEVKEVAKKAEKEQEHHRAGSRPRSQTPRNEYYPTGPFPPALEFGGAIPPPENATSGGGSGTATTSIVARKSETETGHRQEERQQSGSRERRRGAESGGGGEGGGGSGQGQESGEQPIYLTINYGGKTVKVEYIPAKGYVLINGEPVSLSKLNEIITKLENSSDPVLRELARKYLEVLNERKKFEERLALSPELAELAPERTSNEQKMLWFKQALLGTAISLYLMWHDKKFAEDALKLVSEVKHPAVVGSFEGLVPYMYRLIEFTHYKPLGVVKYGNGTLYIGVRYDKYGVPHYMILIPTTYHKETLYENVFNRHPLPRGQEPYPLPETPTSLSVLTTKTVVLGNKNVLNILSQAANTVINQHFQSWFKKNVAPIVHSYLNDIYTNIAKIRQKLVQTYMQYVKQVNSYIKNIIQTYGGLTPQAIQLINKYSLDLWNKIKSRLTTEYKNYGISPGKPLLLELENGKVVMRYEFPDVTTETFNAVSKQLYSKYSTKLKEKFGNNVMLSPAKFTTVTIGNQKYIVLQNWENLVEANLNTKSVLMLTKGGSTLSHTLNYIAEPLREAESAYSNFIETLREELSKEASTLYTAAKEARSEKDFKKYLDVLRRDYLIALKHGLYREAEKIHSYIEKLLEERKELRKLARSISPWWAGFRAFEAEFLPTGETLYKAMYLGPIVAGRLLKMKNPLLRISGATLLFASSLPELNALGPIYWLSPGLYKKIYKSGLKLIEGEEARVAKELKAISLYGTGSQKLAVNIGGAVGAVLNIGQGIGEGIPVAVSSFTGSHWFSKEARELIMWRRAAQAGIKIPYIGEVKVEDIAGLVSPFIIEGAVEAATKVAGRIAEVSPRLASILTRAAEAVPKYFELTPEALALKGIIGGARKLWTKLSEIPEIRNLLSKVPIKIVSREELPLLRIKERLEWLREKIPIGKRGKEEIKIAKIEIPVAKLSLTPGGKLIVETELRELELPVPESYIETLKGIAKGVPEGARPGVRPEAHEVYTKGTVLFVKSRSGKLLPLYAGIYLNEKDINEILEKLPEDVVKRLREGKTVEIYPVAALYNGKLTIMPEVPKLLKRGLELETPIREVNAGVAPEMRLRKITKIVVEPERRLTLTEIEAEGELHGAKIRRRALLVEEEGRERRRTLKMITEEKTMLREKIYEEKGTGKVETRPYTSPEETGAGLSAMSIAKIREKPGGALETPYGEVAPFLREERTRIVPFRVVKEGGWTYLEAGRERILLSHGREMPEVTEVSDRELKITLPDREYRTAVLKAERDGVYLELEKGEEKIKVPIYAVEYRNGELHLHIDRENEIVLRVPKRYSSTIYRFLEEARESITRRYVTPRNKIEVTNVSERAPAPREVKETKVKEEGEKTNMRNLESRGGGVTVAAVSAESSPISIVEAEKLAETLDREGKVELNVDGEKIRIVKQGNTISIECPEIPIRDIRDIQRMEAILAALRRIVSRYGIYITWRYDPLRHAVRLEIVGNSVRMEPMLLNAVAEATLSLSKKRRLRPAPSGRYRVRRYKRIYRPSTEVTKVETGKVEVSSPGTAPAATSASAQAVSPAEITFTVLSAAVQSAVAQTSLFPGFPVPVSGPGNIKYRLPGEVGWELPRLLNMLARVLGVAVGSPPVIKQVLVL